MIRQALLAIHLTAFPVATYASGDHPANPHSCYGDLHTAGPEIIMGVQTYVGTGPNDTPPCTMAYGFHGCLCGYQCFDTSSKARLNDCTQTNACGRSCLDPWGARDYMNNMTARTCNMSSQYVNTSLWPNGNKPWTQAMQAATVFMPLDASGMTWGSCVNLTSCKLNVTYQFIAPTRLSDRICSKVSPPCNESMYQAAAPTLTSDRNCSVISKCNYSIEFEAAKPTATTDRVCTSLLTGFVTATNGAIDLAFSGRPGDALDKLLSMQALAHMEIVTSTDLQQFYANMSIFAANLRSGFDATGQAMVLTSSAVQWGAPSGPKSQLQSMVATLQEFEAVKRTLQLKQVLDAELQAAVRAIHSHIDAQVDQLSVRIADIAQTLVNMQHVQQDILSQVQQNGQALIGVKHDMEKSTPIGSFFSSIFEAVTKGISAAEDLAKDPIKAFEEISSVINSGYKLYETSSKVIAGLDEFIVPFIIEERRRPTISISRRSKNQSYVIGSDAFLNVLELKTFNRYTTALAKKFTTPATGWDTAGTGFATKTDALAFLADIGADADVVSAVTQALASGQTTWPTFLNASVHGKTLGEYAIEQVSCESQPLRLRLNTIMSVWAGLEIAVRPIAYLADGPAPNQTYCYGNNPSEVIKQRMTCKTTFPVGCTMTVGYGFWDNTTGTVKCDSHQKSFADVIAEQHDAMVRGFNASYSMIERTMLQSVQWLKSKGAIGDSKNPMSVSRAAFSTVLDDIIILGELNQNTRSFEAGNLTFAQHPEQSYNLSNAFVENRVKRNFVAIVGDKNYTQYFSGATVFSNAMVSRQHLSMFRDLAQLQILMQRLVTDGLLIPPPCMFNSTTGCTTSEELGYAMGYMDAAISQTLHSAFHVLNDAKQELIYDILDPSLITAYVSLPQPKTSADLSSAIISFDTAHSISQNELGGAGNMIKIKYDVSRDEMPDQFRSLEATGVIGLSVPWPANPRRRRAKLLSKNVRGYFLGSKDGDYNVAVIKGNYSVFFPLDRSSEGAASNSAYSTSVQLFAPALAPFISNFGYRQENGVCHTATSACNGKSCLPNDSLLVSPYGDWLIRGEGSMNGVALPTNVTFKDVQRIRLVFEVWYYDAGSGQDQLFFNNTCQNSQCLVSDGDESVCSLQRSPTTHDAITSSHAAIIGGSIGGAVLLIGGVALLVYRRKRSYSATSPRAHISLRSSVQSGRVRPGLPI